MKLLSPDQLAEAASLSPATVRDLCRRGKLPGAKKVGNQWRISERRFLDWLESDDPPAPEGAKVIELPSRKRRASRATTGGKW